MRDIRLPVLILLIALSLYFVFSPMVFKKSGVVVSFIEANANCIGVSANDIITQANGQPVGSASDFYNIVSGIKSGQQVQLTLNNQLGTCTAINDGDVGFNIQNIPATNLKFGIEIQGGTSVLLKPDIANVTAGQISETARILEERVNLFGLSDIQVTTLGSNLIQLQTSSLSGNDIQNFLAKQGHFEGDIAEGLNFANGTSDILVSGVSYPVSLSNGRVVVNQSSYGINDTFDVDGVDFQVYNVTNSSSTVLAEIFTGSDIITVLTDPQHSGITATGNGYQFTFSVQVTKASADRFAKATENQPTYLSNGQSYIIYPLVLLLDSQPVSSLNIVASLAGQSLTTPTIQGFGPTQKDAQNQMLRLETVLRSGSLPVTLSIERVDTVTQSEGSSLLNSTFIVLLIAAVVVAVIIFIRYRDFKLALPMLLLSFSELLLILGFAASQLLGGLIIVAALFVGVYTKSIHGIVGWVTVGLMSLIAIVVVANSWTLDIPAIAGMIAVLGTSVNQMIIITDQLLLDKEKDIHTRHMTALEIVTNSASMVTFAMLPLVFIGIGTLKGFAITTVVGVMVGFLLTRPAYMAVLERIKKLYA